MAKQRASWLTASALLVMTSVLSLQYTKQAMLPRNQNPVLWGAEIATVAAALLLSSGAMRDSGWAEEQARLGTLANNFYEPRREWLIHAFAIGLGTLGGLWWGLATWAVLFTGARRHVVGRGLADFEVAAICGVIAGAMIGAALGLTIGHLWETSHRRSRRNRSTARA